MLSPHYRLRIAPPNIRLSEQCLLNAGRCVRVNERTRQFVTSVGVTLSRSIRPRFTIAGEYPCAADFRKRFLALRWSGGTPRPLSYIMPNLFCASALPRFADVFRNFTAFE